MNTWFFRCRYELLATALRDAFAGAVVVDKLTRVVRIRFPEGRFPSTAEILSAAYRFRDT